MVNSVYLIKHRVNYVSHFVNPQTNFLKNLTASHLSVQIGVYENALGDISVIPNHIEKALPL